MLSVLAGCHSPSSEERPRVVLDDGSERPLSAVPKALDDLLDTIEDARLSGDLAGLPRLHLQAARQYVELEDWRDARKQYRYALYQLNGEPGLHADRALSSLHGDDRVLAEECLAGIAESHLREGNARSCVLALRDTIEHFDRGTSRTRAARAYIQSLEQIGRSDEALAWREEIGDRELPAAPHLATDELAHVTILPRSSWKPRPARGTPPPLGRATRITIHHSAIDAPGPAATQAASQIQSIQRTHLGNRWDDIGYHFLIDPTGRTWEGRPVKYQGAHAGNGAANQGNIGICLLGNFEHGKPPAAQWKTMVALVEQLRAQYGIARRELYGHREMRERYTGQTTLCPGRHLEEMLGSLRTQDPAEALAAARAH